MKKMRLPISEQYFDPLKERDLIEDCILWLNVNWEVLEFATDYYWVEDWLNAIIDYYDLQDDFEEYMKENRKGYVLDSDED